MSVTTSVFLVYLLVLAGMALWSRRETHTVSGYFIAGKKLPPWVVAFSRRSDRDAKAWATVRRALQHRGALWHNLALKFTTPAPTVRRSARAGGHGNDHRRTQ